MAQEQSINTSANPTVVIGDGNGELRLMGWDRPMVLARADGTLIMKQDGDTVTIQYTGETVVRVPGGASLRIDNIRTDGRIKGVDGSITIANASGDLSLRNIGLVHIQSSMGDTSLKQVRGEIQLDNAQGDLSITGVLGPVMVGNVGGDLDARSIQGALSVKNVSGDMSLQGVQGQVDVESVSGDMRLVGVQGDTRFGAISGDASLAGIQGSVSTDKIGGDLNVEGVTSITANVSGDASLALSAQGVGQTTVTASGDITCRIMSDASATLHLTSGSSHIILDLPEVQSELKQHDYELRLGSGEVPINLTAGGDLSVRSGSGQREGTGFDAGFNFNFEHDDFFDSRNWGAFGERIAEHARRAAEKATARAREHTERAARKAEAQVRHAQEQAERAARKAERRAQFMGRRFGAGFDSDWRAGRPPTPPTPFTPPAPPGEPVSDEERLTILRMLEDKKINVEQAEKLLAALVGKER